MWDSNQVVDFLANDVAHSHRVSKDARNRVHHRNKQLHELAIYIGKLTFVANHFVTKDGKILHDSDLFPKGKRKYNARAVTSARKKTRGKKPTIIMKGTACKREPLNDDWIRSWKSFCTPGNVQPPRVSKVTKESRIKSSIAHRQEAAFQATWRENRERTLQPRDATLPSATDRQAALCQRVLARSRVNA